MIPTPQAHQALPNVPPKEPPAVTADCVHRVSPQTGHRHGVMPKKQNRKINFKLISIFNWTEEIKKLLIMEAQHTIIIIHFRSTQPTTHEMWKTLTGLVQHGAPLMITQT